MEEKKQNTFEEIAQSNTAKIVLGAIGIIVIILVIFQAGMAVGFHKANFGKDWGTNYNENFGPQRGIAGEKINRQYPNAHGANGRIIEIELPSVVVADRDNREKVVVLNEKTKILERDQEIQPEDLDTDDFIVVLGNPNEQGQIEAKFVRILPNPGMLSPQKR